MKSFDQYIADAAAYDLTVPIAPVRDLVLMHLEPLDECGLITPDVEARLPHELRKRLSALRQQYSGDEFAEE